MHIVIYEFLNIVGAKPTATKYQNENVCLLFKSKTRNRIKGIPIQENEKQTGENVKKNKSTQENKKHEGSRVPNRRKFGRVQTQSCFFLLVVV